MYTKIQWASLISKGYYGDDNPGETYSEACAGIGE